MKPLAIKEVTFTHFKNYTGARFSLGDKFNLVYGLNGTGKTNLLDGIYYLCVGKSYFTGFDQKAVQFGHSFFRLEAKVDIDHELHDLVIKVRPGELKEISVDGVALDRISDHLGYMPVVISAPKDIDLIQGGSQSRRRYIDHLLCQVDPPYLRALMAYNHLLHMRSAALKQDYKDLKRMIDTIDAQMNDHASLIYQKRKWLREEIAFLLEQNYTILSDNREQVQIDYESKLHEYNYAVLADMNWERDRQSLRSNGGIHKDDFNFTIKEMPAREYGSQGQIKSLIFALHLSKFRILSTQRNIQPILILDDIFDKLDEGRLSRLMEILLQPDFGQVLLSDTTRNRVGDFVPKSLLTEIAMQS